MRCFHLVSVNVIWVEVTLKGSQSKRPRKIWPDEQNSIFSFSFFFISFLFCFDFLVGSRTLQHSLVKPVVYFLHWPNIEFWLTKWLSKRISFKIFLLFFVSDFSPPVAFSVTLIWGVCSVYLPLKCG